MKRMFDLFVAAIAILVLIPLLVLVIVILRLTGEGEVFFCQTRIGRQRKPFGILKFATMLKDSQSLPGGDITVRSDPRVLRFGKFLRKTKINELPQLFNVLIGDMSLIGYRPLTPRVAALFDNAYWQQVGHLRPGLSGVGSIVFRDEEAVLGNATDREKTYRDVIVPQKAALELWYANHVGMFTDLKLIIFTLVAVVIPDFDIRRYFAGLPVLAITE